MLLIADSGSTKTEWALIENNSVHQTLLTKGFNPYYYKKDAFVEEISKSLADKLPLDQIEQIYFYGAGCSTIVNCDLVKNALAHVFKNAQIHIEHDLYAAGLALFGRNDGIACILGTGSNSCLWKNKTIVNNVPSLGFMLGDEGSGTHIGKLLLKGILLGEADKELTNKFYSAFQLDFGLALNKIYKETDPNLFYSSISPFAKKHITNPYCTFIVKQSFSKFIDRYISKYESYQSLPISFIGSVAAHFQKELKAILEEHQMNFGRILKKPMDGLIEYHMENN